jgi:CheY-like chemotaxis protein
MFGFGKQRDSSKKLVVHIDDEADIRLMIEAALAPLGVEVLGAPDGNAGLALAKKEKPDLILLDILMPGLDGYETCLHLRKVPGLKGTPILMLTALSQMKNVEKAMAQGADGYILKPFDMPQLRQKVAEALKIPLPPAKPAA